jgi:hypothetical protein
VEKPNFLAERVALARIRSDPVALRRRTAEESRARAFTGKKCFFNSARGSFGRSRLEAFWYTAWKSADARNGPHTQFNSFPLSLPGSTGEGDEERNVGGHAARHAEKRARACDRRFSFPSCVFPPRPSPVKPATFLLIKNFTEPRLSPRYSPACICRTPLRADSRAVTRARLVINKRRVLRVGNKSRPTLCR